MEKILDTVKQHVGVVLEYDHFDPQLIDDINAAFFTLNQLGVGPEEPFVLTSVDTTWDDFFGDSTPKEAVKQYVAKSVQLVFDPPDRAALLDSLQKKVEELEFRLMIDAERPRAYPSDMSGIYMEN